MDKFDMLMLLIEVLFLAIYASFPVFVIILFAVTVTGIVRKNWNKDGK